jgi:hypothetical protein
MGFGSTSARPDATCHRRHVLARSRLRRRRPPSRHQSHAPDRAVGLSARFPARPRRASRSLVVWTGPFPPASHVWHRVPLASHVTLVILRQDVHRGKGHRTGPRGLHNLFYRMCSQALPRRAECRSAEAMKTGYVMHGESLRPLSLWLEGSTLWNSPRWPEVHTRVLEAQGNARSATGQSMVPGPQPGSRGRAGTGGGGFNGWWFVVLVTPQGQHDATGFAAGVRRSRP